MDIAALGYEIDSSQAVTAAKDLDLMASRAQLAERVARRLSSAANGSIGGIGAMGVNAKPSHHHIAFQRLALCQRFPTDACSLRI